MQIRHLILALLLSSLLTGCGFQLRGATELPPSLTPIQLIGKPGTEVFTRALAERLQEDGISAQRIPKGAASRLLINHHTLDRRALSVDSNGKVAEYELHESIHFTLTDVRGNTLVAPQTARVVRSYINTEEQVLGKQQEEGLLRADMRRDLIDQFLRRLKTQLK